MNATSMLGPLAAFVLVLALIPVALWLLKRSPMGGSGAGGTLRLVGTLALAPNQRVVTVEVGSGEDRRWLVLGLSPAGIRTLHTLPPQAEAPASTGAAMPLFAQLLSRHQRVPTPTPAPSPGSQDAR
jgi:flagellar protein FliO/FliZ